MASAPTRGLLGKILYDYPGLCCRVTIRTHADLNQQSANDAIGENQSSVEVWATPASCLVPAVSVVIVGMGAVLLRYAAQGLW